MRLTILFLAAIAAFAQTKDAGPRGLATSATLPAACAVGELFYKTGSGAGLYTCSAIDTWSITGAGSRVLIAGPTAVCQAGVAAISGSLPSSNAPTATCEADGLSAYAAFTYNGGSGQTMYQRIELPQDWAGTLKLNISGWSTSTSAATVNVSTGCVGTAGATTGITFNSPQAITFTPTASSYRTTSAANSLTTTGCAAGRSLTVKYNIVGESGGTAVNIRTLQVTE